MNKSAIKNYAVWARRELMGEVEKRCAWWDVSEGADGDLDTVDGRVLGAHERDQRKERQTPARPADQIAQRKFLKSHLRPL